MSVLSPRVAPATPWNDRVAFDMALLLEGSGETLDDIADRYAITSSDIIRYKEDPLFIKRVEDYREDVRDQGLTFRVKARAQAEELLTTSWLLIHNEDVSPSVKADLIKSTVKWAGLEVKPDAQIEAGGGGGVQISINLGGAGAPASPSNLIDVTPSLEKGGD